MSARRVAQHKHPRARAFGSPPGPCGYLSAGGQSGGNRLFPSLLEGPTCRRQARSTALLLAIPDRKFQSRESILLSEAGLPSHHEDQDGWRTAQGRGEDSPGFASKLHAKLRFHAKGRSRLDGDRAGGNEA